MCRVLFVQRTLASLSKRPPVTLTCSTLGLRSIADPNIFFTFQGQELGESVGSISTRHGVWFMFVYRGEFPDMDLVFEMGKEKEIGIQLS